MKIKSQKGFIGFSVKFEDKDLSKHNTWLCSLFDLMYADMKKGRMRYFFMNEEHETERRKYDLDVLKNDILDSANEHWKWLFLYKSNFLNDMRTFIYLSEENIQNEGWQDIEYYINLDCNTLKNDYLGKVIKFICAYLNVIYGKLVYHNDYDFFEADLTFNTETAAGGEKYKETRFNLDNRMLLFESLPRAYYGNVLNKMHVKKLGGLEKIRKSAPAFVEELPNGACFIRTFDKIDDLFEDNALEKVIQLDQYFSHIIIDGRPKIIWK